MEAGGTRGQPEGPSAPHTTLPSCTPGPQPGPFPHCPLPPPETPGNPVQSYRSDTVPSPACCILWPHMTFEASGDSPRPAQLFPVHPSHSRWRPPPPVTMEGEFGVKWHLRGERLICPTMRPRAICPVRVPPDNRSPGAAAFSHLGRPLANLICSFLGCCPLPDPTWPCPPLSPDTHRESPRPLPFFPLPMSIHLTKNGQLLCGRSRQGVGQASSTAPVPTLTLYPVHWPDLSQDPKGRGSMGRAPVSPDPSLFVTWAEQSGGPMSGQ